MKLKILINIILIATLHSQFGKDSKPIEFTTIDSILIKASYQYGESVRKQMPAIILIHQGGSSREEWFQLKLWDDLIKAGYAILAYDVRQHGKSAKDSGSMMDLFNNSSRAPNDLLAAIHFLKKDKIIDSNRIGIIGASIGANLACVASSSKRYSIKSAVSMSSKTSAAQNLSGQKQTIQLSTVFHIASKNEQGGKRAAWANELYSMTHGNRKIKIADGNKHGSYILRDNINLQTEILNWFKQTL